MERRKGVLLLCDAEEEYAQLMAEFLGKKKELPWEIHTYTDVYEMLKKEDDVQAPVVVIAESAYCKDVGKLEPEHIILLNESGTVQWDKLPQINKYQQADAVFQELLEIYARSSGKQLPRLPVNTDTRFIGMYSPVHRCLQTSFALTMSQMLAQEYRTLYLNFEHYVGITELLPDRQTRDLADLLYFLNGEEEKFRLRLRTMIRKMGALDYIPPMKYGQNLLEITAEEWLSLLRKISETGDYDYVILDLSESVQGLFEILRMCCKIFTLTEQDKLSRAKVLQYEQVLSLYEYRDVLGKTRKCGPIHIKRLPEQVEQYTKGDLAEYVRKELKTLKNTGG